MIEVRAEGFEGSTGFGFRSARAAGVAAGAAGLSRLGFLSPERSDRFFLSAGSFGPRDDPQQISSLDLNRFQRYWMLFDKKFDLEK